MRLEWLEDILAVDETGSLHEAGERRHLTQSAFSRRIQNIESYVGVELFDRSHKPVHLRPTTAAQRDRIQRLAAELRQLVVDLRNGERIAANRIVIASQHSLTTSLTPSMVEGIHARNREIYVRLRSANLDECFALLLSRQADIAVVYRQQGQQHAIRADYIESAVIGADALIPVFSGAGLARLNARFLEGEVPYVAYPGSVFLGQVMGSDILPRVQSLTRPVPMAETALTLAALEMAAVGVAVAWVPASLAAGRLTTGELVDLSATLPRIALDVTAVRIKGNAGPIERDVWQQLTDPAGR